MAAKNLFKSIGDEKASTGELSPRLMECEVICIAHMVTRKTHRKVFGNILNCTLVECGVQNKFLLIWFLI